MIKYRPVRETISKSLKEEETFESMEQLKQYIFDKMHRIMAYIGADELSPEEIIIESQNDPYCLYKDMHSINVRNNCIGFCGEQ